MPLAPSAPAARARPPEPNRGAPKLTPGLERFRCALLAVLRVARERLREEALERGVDGLVEHLAELARLVLRLELDHLQDVPSRVGELPAERLVDERRDRVDVSAVIDGLRFADLLGRHEREGPEALPHLGERLATDLARQLRDAEVEQLDAHAPVRPALEEHVRRLEIAVDDASLVRVDETHPDLLHEREELVEAHRPCALEPLDERLTLEHLEDDEDPVLFVFLDVEDLGHVVAVDRAGSARLTLEPRDGGALLLGVGAQDLHRDDAAGADVLRREHFAHAATTQRLLDSVAGGENGSCLDIQETSAIRRTSGRDVRGAERRADPD
jgi:hypothetical protein